ncbi:unnamed protein product [Brassicogethes aeneus]|uniref:BESS domain-containing protein n=1 Tax=Brassicogethes aeneus TaxID=1431903 RepID=A0A9P0BAM5_BRAAE|nr:unnamed protein product [Brassicogethes aeneus]
MKQNAEFRREKASKKPVELDNSDIFYLSMSKADKKLPEIHQARIKMELCRLVTEAQIKNAQSRTNSTPENNLTELASTRSTPVQSSSYSPSFSTLLSTHDYNEFLPECSSAAMWRS